MQFSATRLHALKSIGLRLDQTVSRRRVLYGVSLPTLQAIFADLAAQYLTNKRDHKYYGSQRNNTFLYKLRHSIQWDRTLVFATFGFCYLGAAQYVLYAKLLNNGLQRFINTQNVMLDRTVKVLFDQCIHTPFLYFPAFYYIKDRIQHHEPA
eukprot:101751_1